MKLTIEADIRDGKQFHARVPKIFNEIGNFPENKPHQNSFKK